MFQTSPIYTEVQKTDTGGEYLVNLLRETHLIGRLETFADVPGISITSSQTNSVD